MALSARFTEALVFAAQLHRAQRRKGPAEIPYLAHLLAVAGTVIEHGGTEEEAIAALLHDAVEDQGGLSTRETILRLFGPEVTEIIDGSTDATVSPKPPWRERKERFLARLATAPASIQLVVLADKLSNVRSTIRDLRQFGGEVWNWFRGGEQGTLWYYRAVVETIRPADARSAALHRELELAVGELESLAAQATQPRT
jgi:(p)ppGpp synthase/HD superfamily hydrolase